MTYRPFIAVTFIVTVFIFLNGCEQQEVKAPTEQPLNAVQEPEVLSQPVAQPVEQSVSQQPVVQPIVQEPEVSPQPIAQRPVVQQPTIAPQPQPFIPQPINICSFNIQFLGNPKGRDNLALAQLVQGFDIVVIQELVAPPFEGLYPDGTPYKPDPEAALFFRAMHQLGFAYILSEEDTGSGDNLHINSSSTEWWVSFFRPSKVQVARDLPGGYLAADRSNHDDYERVPYAFPFRTVDGTSDFVIISTHLQPDQGPSYRARRKHELQAIANWIDAHDQIEQDFIVLGDMNIESQKELLDATPHSFLSLNDECRATNTKGDRPYDHVMYRPQYTVVDPQIDMQVIDLVKAMQPAWNRPEPYPGAPYNHNGFRAVYSDHHPVWFRMMTQQFDDDRAVAMQPMIP